MRSLPRFLFLSASLVTLSLACLSANADNPDEDEGVIYPSNAHMKIQEQRNSEYRTPDAKKVRYVPLGNDPEVDPFDQSYRNWLQEIREESLIGNDLSGDYESFVKEISPLLFSLGHNELSPEVKELISDIPANSLEYLGNRFDPKGPIGVDRFRDRANPFANIAPAEEEILGQELGLDIQVKSPDSRENELLSMAYDAMQAGQAEGAVALYSQILEQDPGNESALFGIATTYHRNGQFDEARQSYVKLLTDNPKNWSALNNLMVLAGEEAPEEALKELQKLELINPEFSPIPAQIGLIYLRLNKIEDAVKYLTRAIMLSPENMAYRYNLAVLLDHGGYKKQAARLYKQLIEASDKGHKLPESVQRIRERLAFISSSPLYVR